MNPTTVQPIATLLIRRVFKWVLLCVVAFSSIHAWLSYQSIERNFDATARDVAETHLPLLSVAIWDIEPQTIQKQITLILKNTSVVYVAITASTGQTFVGGERGMVGMGKHMVFDIPAPAGNASKVGTLDLVVDTRILHRELIQSFLLITIEVVLLAVLILTAVVALLRRDLERPMRQLADYVRNIQADQLSSAVPIALPDVQAYSEIDLVYEGFQVMHNRIKQHIVHQDALVMERTMQLEKAMESLKQLSITDGLTGCYNRLLFNERMPSEMRRAKRYERPLSIIFCDIDFFKKVNDQYGHSVGDKVLIAFVQCLMQEIRVAVDWVVRYGGEEFVVVLPETRLSSAIEVAERMRRRVESTLESVITSGEGMTITASFGVAQKTEIDNIDSLVNRADSCLYVAKSSGRNRVCPSK